MSRSRTPLKAAFWSIAAALALTLALTLSDPHAIRLAILSDRTSSDPQPIAMSDGSPLLSRRVAQPDISEATDDDRMPSIDGDPERTLTASVGPFPTSAHENERDLPSDMSEQQVPLPTPADDLSRAQFPTATIVSSQLNADESPAPALKTITQVPAMPILSPAHLRGDVRRGEFFELPPPPATDEETQIDPADPLDVLRLPTLDNPSPALPEQLDSVDKETKLLRLEADVLILRREVSQLHEERLDDRFQDLQNLHEKLLRRQTDAADRLEQLAKEVEARSQDVKAFLNEAASVTGTADEADSAELPPESAVGLGVPQLETTVDGRERFSLVIECSSVADVLERLGTWSQESAVSMSVAPSDRGPHQLPQTEMPTPLSTASPFADEGFFPPPVESHSCRSCHSR